MENELNKKVNKGGSQFADVSNYLNQNQEQGKRLAADVGQSVVDTGNKAREGAQNVQKSFNQNVNASTIPYNEAVAQRATTDPRSFYNYQAPTFGEDRKTRGIKAGNKGAANHDFSNVVNYLSQQSQKGPGKGPVSQAFSPTVADTTGTPEDVAEFQRMRDAQYTGPMDLTGQEGYQDALGLESAARERAQLVDTDVGRQDLLQGISNPSQSASALDQLLLGTGGAQSILDESAAGNRGLDLAGENESARERALAAQETTDATRDRIQSDMTSAFSNLKSDWKDSDSMRGGRHFRERKKYNDQTNEQTLDALNRLMGTDYNKRGL